MKSTEYCNEISELLQIINSKVTKKLNQSFSGQNLTAPSINILLLLNTQGAMRVSDIAATLNMVDSNVSAICSRLEKMKYIERIRQKEDHRVVMINLTQTAIGKMDEINSNLNKFQQDIVKNVSEKDLHQIVVALKKLNNLFDL
ncbi:MarR family winged helix-turn-helix transcriptional regulator [Sedimentibacter sp.]|uniref:MarR family winged helix-turn-helix transcriptional regulator n=1 Tax=Sedimentibacter sp. TaxID=1960295 RepID=UPI0028A211E1|nr:MarR family winged helix-turn-helix transcriptional regulator [Sedimentibacter sp.]